MSDRWADKPNRHAYCDAEVERLRVESEKLRRKLAATIEVRDDAIRALDDMQFERDQRAATIARVRALAVQWEAEGAWTVHGSDSTESAATELRAALGDPGGPCQHDQQRDTTEETK